jgi:hypothetical protein
VKLTAKHSRLENQKLKIGLRVKYSNAPQNLIHRKTLKAYYGLFEKHIFMQFLFKKISI